MPERVLQRGRDLKHAVTDDSGEQRGEPSCKVGEVFSTFSLRMRSRVNKFDRHQWHQKAEDEVQNVKQMFVRHWHLRRDDAGGALEEVHFALCVQVAAVEEEARVFHQLREFTTKH